jgi:UDP-N-acetyl-D-galactosamine dehydrogenase
VASAIFPGGGIRKVTMSKPIKEKISVIGLGYVGLPLAVALADKCDHVLGFDISKRRVDSINAGEDWTGEVEPARLAASGLRASSSAGDISGSSVIIVTVPTPVDADKRPDLTPIRKACETIAPHLCQGVVVVFESTVYPGVTEEFCGPILTELSGLDRDQFKLAYSPERINPGDKKNTLEKIVKVVAGEDAETLERVAAVYGAIIEAGIHKAPSIKVAEAAKVIENTQRDINIALMNELALIFDKLDIRTKDVLEAAGTKWNFLPFTPGLVGGHCIGVDPYYLTAKAESVGHHPEVILAGRRINDDMGRFVARKTIKLLIERGLMSKHARVAILGLTFKENVPDLRNSKVIDIVEELAEYGIEALVHDPMVSSEDAMQEYGIELCSAADLSDLDAVIMAVNHQHYLSPDFDICQKLKQGGVLVDVKSAFHPGAVREDLRYWSL